MPSSVADLIEPELGEVTKEILATIAREVGEYERPLEGKFGSGIRRGVGEALSQFVALIRDPDAGRELGREVYVALGRGEMRQGRTLDSLQAAYRIGARVAWRRLSLAGRKANLDPEALSLLAEAIFAYIDELSADSVEGFAQAQAEREDVERRHRQVLASMLMREPMPGAADLRAAAQTARWRIPRRVAPLACAEPELGRLAHRLPVDCLVTQIDEVGCVLVSDPEGPGRLTEVERAASGRTVALGPACEPTQLRDSWQLAKSALRALEAGAISSGGSIRAEDHLADLLLFEGSAVVARLAAHRLAPLEPLTPKARERMRETALAYVRHGGNAVEMAAALHLHPQTVRYRVARLRELLGDALDDPDARFELQIALRVG